MIQIRQLLFWTAVLVVYVDGFRLLGVIIDHPRRRRIGSLSRLWRKDETSHVLLWPQAEATVRHNDHDGPRACTTRLHGWVQGADGEWEWEEDDPDYVPLSAAASQQQDFGAGMLLSEEGGGGEAAYSSTTTAVAATATATPTLPKGSFRPKQSLGQNFLRDGNTVLKIIRAFHKDATTYRDTVDRIVELGPGAGALTDPLVKSYGADVLQCIEIDDRSVEILAEKHPTLLVHHDDVLQVDYPTMVQREGQPLVVVGNLPYYITSQILFALADAAHFGAVHSATVTMQWEVGLRMVAPIQTKDYGILSVVFQIYADVHLHFKIPPTVFYPQPKVDSCLIGLHFYSPKKLRQRLAGVDPANLRIILKAAFQQRRKTVRNSLKKLAKELCHGDAEQAQALLNAAPLPLPAVVREAGRGKGAETKFAKKQALPEDWASRRPEELNPGQFIELTRLFYGPKPLDEDGTLPETELEKPLGNKVWRKLKHGPNP